MQRREDLASIEGLHNPWASFQAEQGRARALGDFKNFAGVLFPVLLVSRAINLGLMSPAHIYPNVFMILVSVFSACWGRYSPESYNLYRTPIIIAFRIAFFALPPFHLVRVFSRLSHRPPAQSWPQCHYFSKLLFYKERVENSPFTFSMLSSWMTAVGKIHSLSRGYREIKGSPVLALSRGKLLTASFWVGPQPSSFSRNSYFCPIDNSSSDYETEQ